MENNKKYDDVSYLKYLLSLNDEELAEEEEKIYNDCCYYNDCSICPHKFYNFQELECEFMCINMKEKELENGKIKYL